MKCVLPAINVKIFARAIHSLARVGDELHVEYEPKGLSLRTVNSSRSAFGSYTFSPRFFTQFDDRQSGGQSNSNIKCRVNMKACVGVFKSLNDIEKSIEKCKLVIDVEDSKFIIQLTCKYNIIKTHNLPFIECDTLQAIFDTSECEQQLATPSKLFADAFSHFQSGLEEVSFQFSSNKAILRNYTDDEPDPSKAIRTETSLEASEFERYKVKGDCQVTFSLKELRALLGFAEPLNLPLTVLFSVPGNPIIFSINNQPIFEVSFVLATLAITEPYSQRTNQTVRNTTAAANRTKSDSCVSNVRANESRVSEHITEQSICVPNNTSLNSNHNGISRNGHSSVKETPIKPKPLSQTLPPINNPTEMNDVPPDDDVISGTPPSKKAKFFFQRCFDLTFNPESLPGHSVVLAEDSDEER